MSEEIKNPHKNLPRAIIIGLVSIVTVYILLTYVCIKALGVTGLAESTKAVASAASVIFGNVGGAIIAVVRLPLPCLDQRYASVHAARRFLSGA